VGDRHEITDLVHQFMGWARDDRDWEALAACVTEDFHYAQSSSAGSGMAVAWETEGPEAFVDSLRRWVPNVAVAQHYLMNVLIEVGNGEATAKAYFHGVVGPKTEGPMQLIDGGGRCHHWLRRTKEGWRISRSEVTMLWSRNSQLLAGMPTPGTPATQAAG
jgi:hypothetical protein